MTVHVPFAITTHSNAWALDAGKLALRQDGIEACYHHLSSEEDYYKLLDGLWDKGEGFITVEHDIVVWPGAIQSLLNCQEPWCSLPYYSSVGWITDGLGCTKFGEELTKRFPRTLKEPFPTCCSHTKYWCGLDRLIAHSLQEAGLTPHVHAPGVINLNDRWT